MNSDRFREILALLDWSQNVAARMLDRDPHDVRRWAQAQKEIPPEDAAWLEDLAAVWARRPTRETRR
jgi:hypothetical protein